MWHHVICWTVLLSTAVLTSVWLVQLSMAISWLALLDCTPDRFDPGRRLTTAGFAGFFVIGFPERVQAWWSGAVTDWLTVCTSSAATLCGLVHVREGGGLRLQAGAFEMTRGIHDWGTWYTGLLPGLFWGLLQRRSGVQMLLLQLLGVVLAMPLVLSCDAMVLFLTGPVCLKGFVNGMAGEEGFSENPVSVLPPVWVPRQRRRGRW